MAKTATKTATSKKTATTARRTKGAKDRRGWSAGDLTELKAFASRRKADRSKAPWSTICNKLRRTAGAIRQKAHAEGISFT